MSANQISTPAQKQMPDWLASGISFANDVKVGYIEKYAGSVAHPGVTIMKGSNAILGFAILRRLVDFHF